jgi:hypothetical protein
VPDILHCSMSAILTLFGSARGDKDGRMGTGAALPDAGPGAQRRLVVLAPVSWHVFTATVRGEKAPVIQLSKLWQARRFDGFTGWQCWPVHLTNVKPNPKPAQRSVQFSKPANPVLYIVLNMFQELGCRIISANRKPEKANNILRTSRQVWEPMPQSMKLKSRSRARGSLKASTAN